MFAHQCPLLAMSGLSHRTGTTTAFICKADIRVRFALSAHQISNRDTTAPPGRVTGPGQPAKSVAPFQEPPVLPCTNSRTIRSRFPFPRQEGTRRRCGPIGKRSRRPEGAGNATRRAALRGPRTSSRAACDAPASRRAALLAGNLARPSYGARNRASEY